ncbi:helix-turn-helix domain-containing protein [Catalinimonas alkaloidigena]|uniref:helix-turn-helix domain-containing protein n=1 Tax=Catalinimonas alkaloidigena TaxID=1075417 RepID=UPI0024057D33|nr:helix-turn-helix domain-containing protein [Catalinimonas alkaloidigena]
MRKPDRHNEIEINYFTEGSITYLFKDQRITIPAKRLTLFWGLIPHQIVHHEGSSPYFVSTIPLSQFLAWKLPASFVDKVLKGELLLEASDQHSGYDEFLFKNWIKDLQSNRSAEVALLEMQARLSRMADSYLASKQHKHSPIHINEVSPVEKIASYIAQNYHKPIKVSDIGEAVGFHPDYANAIFKKAFGSTLSEYITEERISHAQRKLIVTATSITEVAFECGFNSISRFNAAFQKLNRCTPRDFRKKYQ